ncbi:MAG: hypothetical protein VW395_04805, partial [Methylotenera sp.]
MSVVTVVTIPPIVVVLAIVFSFGSKKITAPDVSPPVATASAIASICGAPNGKNSVWKSSKLGASNNA